MRYLRTMDLCFDQFNAGSQSLQNHSAIEAIEQGLHVNYTIHFTHGQCSELACVDGGFVGF